MTAPIRTGDMALLTVRIEVNRAPLVHVEIRNVGHPAGAALDVRKYEWSARGPDVVANGTLDHARSQGALALVDRVLDEVALWMPQPAER